MGSRAHYAIREEGGYSLYSSHWGAESMGRDMFWGPAESTAFVRSQKPLGPHEWMSEVWCEGAALIDPLTNRLLLFGGGPETELPARRIYLQLLAASWTGWSIEWAHRGLGDIVGSLGIDRSAVEDPLGIETDPLPVGWERGRERESSCITLVTLVQDAMASVFKTDVLVQDVVSAGISKVPADRISDGVPLEGLPLGGIHIDLDARIVQWWTAESDMRGDERGLTCWPGFALEWEHDRFEEHLTRIGDAQIVALPDRRTLVDGLRTGLCNDSSPYNATLTDRLAKELGEGVTFHRDFSTHTAHTLNRADRERGFDELVAGMGLGE